MIDVNHREKYRDNDENDRCDNIFPLSHLDRLYQIAGCRHRGNYRVQSVVFTKPTRI